MSRMFPKAAALASLLAAAMAGPSPSARAQYRGHAQPIRLPDARIGVDAFPVSSAPIGRPGPALATPFPGGFPGPGVPFPTPTPTSFPAPQPMPTAFRPGVGSCGPGVSPAVVAVDALIAQVGAFLQVFGPTAHCVPQGDCIERDATALYRSALAFRQAATAGAPPHVLLGLFAEMDSSCCRLVTRVNRIACGRDGPNIQQVRLIGALCDQLRGLI